MADKAQEETEDLEELDEDAEEASDGEPAKKRFAGRKLVLFIILPVLLLAGGGAAIYFTGLLDPIMGTASSGEGEEAEEEYAGPSVYLDLPEMLVNLNGTGRRTNYLKVVVSLELENAGDVARLEAVMPRIIDNFQVFLRELRVEDLRGSAGMYRLKEELLFRVNTAAKPVRVRDVLFREMLVQ
ncbi:MAG: flagellar basal body-associated FliL family protein [Alphaproteobacteria bacterium]|nr:flagellar basal body-associated FliL family protein [Alphaproteobacteria bacterium]